MILAERIAAEGEARGLAKLVLRQLSLRFGPVPQDVTDRIRGASAEQLDHWGERLLSAAKLEDVFE